MTKNRHVKIINRSHGVAILFSMTMGSCHAGDYEIKENCAPIDTCGDGIDNDCKNGIDDGCDCMTIDEKRLRIPLLLGKDPLQLTFGPSSACQLDTEVCKDQNGDGKYKWVSQGTGRGPLASTDVTCDGKDDDCDGQIDEDVTYTANKTNYPINRICYDGIGACKRAGIVVCKNGSPICDGAPAPAPTPPTKDIYHSYPYVYTTSSSSVTLDWDWDCDGNQNAIACLGSMFADPKNINWTNSTYCSNSGLPLTQNPSLYSSSPCSGSCSSGTVPYWQFSTLASLTSPTMVNCGNIYPIVQCSWSGGTSTTCNVTKSDSLIVLCK